MAAFAITFAIVTFAIVTFAIVTFAIVTFAIVNGLALAPPRQHFGVEADLVGEGEQCRDSVLARHATHAVVVGARAANGDLAPRRHRPTGACEQRHHVGVGPGALHNCRRCAVPDHEVDNCVFGAQALAPGESAGVAHLGG
jgi:hypothetical protein